MDKLFDKAKKVFRDFELKKNLRDTKQRNEIVDIFLKTDKHLTADELYEIIKKKDQRIGFATVYRTLKMLQNCGLADEIKIGSGKALYEHKFGHEHHDHLICTDCGKLIEIKSIGIERLQDKIVKENNFLPFRHKLEIYGLCKDCK